jgi:hypothetical protein
MTTIRRRRRERCARRAARRSGRDSGGVPATEGSPTPDVSGDPVTVRHTTYVARSFERAPFDAASSRPPGTAAPSDLYEIERDGRRR